MDRSEFDSVVKSLKCLVESEELAGIEEIFLATGAKKEKAAEKKEKAAVKDTDRTDVKGREASLVSHKRRVLSCAECDLVATRKNVVFGEGNPDADLMFIGEAPGRDEDLQGRPFVGRAGQLLTKIIESIGLRREDIYIANILKCRPPGNRNPMPTEIATCTPHLVKQIELIKPRVICALGKFAAQTLLDTETPISRLRGNWHEYRGIKLMPTYHPAYLLRNPGGKRDVWVDMKKIAHELGIKIPKKKK